MKSCPQCRAEVPVRFRFCNSCGAELPAEAASPSDPLSAAPASVCPDCGAPLRSNTQFCTYCGHSLAASAAPIPRPPSESRSASAPVAPAAASPPKTGAPSVPGVSASQLAPQPGARRATTDKPMFGAPIPPVHKASSTRVFGVAIPLWIAGVIVLLLILAGVGWYAWGVELQVQTNPPGAQVFLDGEKVGSTPADGSPLVVRHVSRKLHNLRISLAGFQDIQVLHSPTLLDFFWRYQTFQLMPVVTSSRPPASSADTGQPPLPTAEPVDSPRSITFWSFLNNGNSVDGIRLSAEGNAYLVRSDGTEHPMPFKASDQLQASRTSPSRRYFFLTAGELSTGQLLLVDRRTGTWSLIARPAYGCLDWLSWSPAETHALIAAALGEGNFAFYAVDLSTGRAVQLTRRGWLPNTSANFTLTEWWNQNAIAVPLTKSVRWTGNTAFSMTLAFYCNHYDQPNCDSNKILHAAKLDCDLGPSGCRETSQGQPPERTASTPAPRPAAPVDHSVAVRQLLAQANTQFEQGQYRPALNSCDQALALDPRNSDARALREKIVKTMNILGIK